MWETVLVVAIVLAAGVYVVYKFGLSWRGGGKSPCSYCPCSHKGDPDAPAPCSSIMERGGKYGQAGGGRLPSCHKWCLNEKASRFRGKEKDT